MLESPKQYFDARKSVKRIVQHGFLLFSFRIGWLLLFRIKIGWLLLFKFRIDWLLLFKFRVDWILLFKFRVDWILLLRFRIGWCSSSCSSMPGCPSYSWWPWIAQSWAACCSHDRRFRGFAHKSKSWQRAWLFTKMVVALFLTDLQNHLD